MANGNKEYRSDVFSMLLQDLIYFAAMMQKKAYAKRRDLYARTLLKIPTPQFIVFYNGKEAAPEQYELRLSDAFEKKTDTPQLELVCRCIRENVLKEFLIEHRMEVTRVMTMDYTFERRLEFQREEAIEEGIQQGRAEGRKEGVQEKLHELIRKKLLKRKPLEQIAEELEESPEAIRPLYEQIQKELAVQK